MKYLVTVDSSATKKYQFNSDMEEDVFELWAMANLERFDTMTNPITEREKHEMKVIEVAYPQIEDWSKTEVYQELFNYIEETTSNLEPLRMLKMLKPEE